MKVYCKNCKWYYGLTICNDNKTRNLCKINEIKFNIIGDKLYSHCLKNNIKYNCKYYKRKLWKVWIKDK